MLLENCWMGGMVAQSVPYDPELGLLCGVSNVLSVSFLRLTPTSQKHGFIGMDCLQ